MAGASAVIQVVNDIELTLKKIKAEEETKTGSSEIDIEEDKWILCEHFAREGGADIPKREWCFRSDEYIEELVKKFREMKNRK